MGGGVTPNINYYHVEKLTMYRQTERQTERSIAPKKWGGGNTLDDKDRRHKTKWVLSRGAFAPKNI